MHYLILSIALFSAIANSAFSAESYSSGTGFFVSRQGEIVTNAHVISPCRHADEIYFTSSENSRPKQATIEGVDKQRDLALLSTGHRPPRVAAMRWMHTKIQEDADVFIIGYPEAKKIGGDYSTATSKVKSLEGPSGEQEWLLFNDASRKGNSGGPLLDLAGNVVGVVTAKNTVARLDELSNRLEIVDTSDVAVHVAELKNFLRRYHVHFEERDSMLELSQRRLEQLSAPYVVHIFCRAT